MSAATLWWISLGVGLVVTGVVALLLALVVRAARDIQGALREIWVAGPRVASNTAHLDLVRRINHQVEALPAAAGRIEAAVGRLHEHADGCPGCPMCVTGWSPGGAP